MEEQFETYDEEGRPTGLAPRSLVHCEGLWHRAANVFLFLPDGRLLIQRRQLDKDVYPGAWDLSAAEHLKPGETYVEGASRGLREELGLTGVALTPIGVIEAFRLERPEQGIRDFEFQQSFRGTLQARVVVTPDPAEVMETRAVDLQELARQFAQRPDEYTPWFRRWAAELALLKR